MSTLGRRTVNKAPERFRARLLAAQRVELDHVLIGQTKRANRIAARGWSTGAVPFPTVLF